VLGLGLIAAALYFGFMFFINIVVGLAVPVHVTAQVGGIAPLLVIPAKAGIPLLSRCPSYRKRKRGSRLRGNDGEGLRGPASRSPARR
jgi:membrane protein implicated in regulation of membrane protease activity